MKSEFRRIHFRTQLSKNRHPKHGVPKDDSGDKWLQRLSHFSQFGLFLFTVGTIYFTVIPLYQKALLDEAIAKKEIDLIDATRAVALKEKALEMAQTELLKKTAELENTAKALTLAEAKVYIQKRSYELNRFTTSVGADCSGLLIPPYVGQDWKAKEKPKYEELLELSPDMCLEKSFLESVLRRILQSADLTKFESELGRTSKLLQELKHKASKDSEGIEALAKKDPKILAPLGPFEAEAEAMISRVNAALLQGRPLDPVSAENRRIRDFQRAVVRTRDAHARQYMEEVRKVVRRLGSETWPN